MQEQIADFEADAVRHLQADSLEQVLLNAGHGFLKTLKVKRIREINSIMFRYASYDSDLRKIASPIFEKKFRSLQQAIKASGQPKYATPDTFLACNIMMTLLFIRSMLKGFDKITPR